MMKRLWQWTTAIAAAGILVACGGGGGAGEPLFGGGGGGGGGGTPAASSVQVLSSANSVGSGAGETVTITVAVLDGNNNALANAPVIFAANTGTLSGVVPTTNAAGLATATFSAGSNRANRVATITARAGTVTGSTDVSIENTRLQYSGPTTLALAASSTLSVIATDSTGQGVAGVPISIASSLGNGLSTTSSTTNGAGQASVTYTAVNAGTDTLTFTGLGVTTTATLTISGEDFRFTDPASASPVTTVEVGTPRAVAVTYRVSGAPQAGVTVSFAATVGNLSAPTAVTNASGVATVMITSAFAGASVITATLPGNIAQATVPLQFIATDPSALVLQVSPTALPPNAPGSTTNQATVLARVTDVSGNPVTGVTVNFSQVADVSGGTLSQASATTDTSGRATVSYIAGANSTPSEGVILRGTVAGSSPVVSGDARLTVSQSALFIALGTGNTIMNLDPQTYQKDFVVYVTDANGVAVPGVTITARALPQEYIKGNLRFVDPLWVYNLRLDCPQEDLNRNGVLDAGEDFNGNGILEPGNVISVSPGTLTTNSTGRGTLSLIYAESFAPWVRLSLQVSATVSGTASTTTSTFIVNGSSEDFTNENVAPAGVVSPFGTNLDCSIDG